MTEQSEFPISGEKFVDVPLINSENDIRVKSNENYDWFITRSMKLGERRVNLVGVRPKKMPRSYSETKGFTYSDGLIIKLNSEELHNRGFYRVMLRSKERIDYIEATLSKSMFPIQPRDIPATMIFPLSEGEGRAAKFSIARRWYPMNGEDVEYNFFLPLDPKELSQLHFDFSTM